MQTSGKWVAREWFELLTFVGLAVAVSTIWQTKVTQAQIAGAVSRAEPPIKQDGTAAHPYSDASQCPRPIDLVFWPSGGSVPNIPPSISVCFVGNQPFEERGADRVQATDAK